MADDVSTQQIEESEVALAEIIYADPVMLLSIDAQLRRGTLEHEERRYESEEGKSRSAEGGIKGFLNIGGTKNEAVTRGGSFIALPHDYKILNLVNDLNLKSFSCNPIPGELVICQGSIQYFDKTQMKSIVQLCKKNGLLPPEFTQCPSSKNKKPVANAISKPGEEWVSKKSPEDIFNTLLSFLPEGPCMMIDIHSDGKVFLPLTPEGMRYSPEWMTATFPTGSLGNWTVFGIVQSIDESIHDKGAKEADFSKGFDILTFASEINKGTRQMRYAAGYPSTTVTPIAIFKTLTGASPVIETNQVDHEESERGQSRKY